MACRSPRTRHVVSAVSLVATCSGDDLGATAVKAIGSLLLYRGGDVEGALVLGASVTSSYSPIGGVVNDAAALVLLAHTRSPYALAAFLATFENWNYVQTALEALMTIRKSSGSRAS